MVWILIAVPSLVLVMLLLLAFKRGPSFTVRLDPPALRTTALVTCSDLETAEMLDVLEVALRQCGYEDVRTHCDRDGYSVSAMHPIAGKRWLSPRVIPPLMQVFTGIHTDDEITRDFLRAFHEALRTDKRVRMLRWVKYEHHSALPDRAETTPFDGF